MANSHADNQAIPAACPTRGRRPTRACAIFSTLYIARHPGLPLLNCPHVASVCKLLSHLPIES